MEQLTEKIKLLTNGKYTLPYCNCLLIEDDINCLVDSSPADQEFEHLKGIDISLIVNSHGHSDHNSRNYAFPDAKVLLHGSEHERVKSGEAYLEAYGFNLYNAEDVRPIYLAAVKYHARPADGEITDGQVISTGSVEFEVMHLPGHSGGHCGFFFPKEGFVFTADIHPELNPFYAMVESDVDQFIDSIKRLIKLQPAMLVAGHGKGVNNKNLREKLTQYLDRFYMRDEEILKKVKNGKHSVAEIADDAMTFGGKFPQPRSIYRLHECIMTLKHLKHLERMDEVVSDDTGMFYLK